MSQGKAAKEKDVFWVGTTLKDLKTFPASARSICGYALRLAQRGLKHPGAKPMHGSLSGVMEICADDDGNTYRTAYTAKIGSVVYALHAFQKKANDGIHTPRRHLELIEKRLKEANEHHERLRRESDTSKKSAGRSGSKKGSNKNHSR